MKLEKTGSKKAGKAGGKVKVLVWCATAEDCRVFEQYNKNRIEFEYTPDTLTEENASSCKGYTGIVIQTRCMITEKAAAFLAAAGVKFIACRSAGFDHVNLAAIKKFGIKACNVPLYSPNAIAEYAVMASMMALRKVKKQFLMTEKGDYTLRGLRGQELRDQTIGIIGTGRIGMESLKLFSAFTRDILLYDPYPKEEAKAMGTYVSQDEIYEKSTLLVFHCPFTKENFHMVNEKSIRKMRTGVILVNPARGGLFDHPAILGGLEDGKIGALAMDVYEDEKSYLRKDLKRARTGDEVFDKLLSMENVIYTAHTAFYTERAIYNMIETTVENLWEYGTTGSCAHELT